MKKLLSLALVTLTTALVVPTLSFAEDQNPPGAGGKGGPGKHGIKSPEERLKMMTEKLGLTPEQQDKIRAIQEKNGPQLKELMAKGRENATEEDKAKLREIMKSQKEEIAAVLTPEQKEKMKEMRRKHEGKPGPDGEGKGKGPNGKHGKKDAPDNN